ncbi:hypothetical protein HOLleu_04046 [Holothuria leucospilota]|uniref:CUB domain-containing protein n=1 Tax=Holothuria leucospilota TaxID=206669 RepID=A0A9Q1CTR9_HOLLE|nr:hypothetical protein HOLleu_04046 [Holothuria leucospilota]
MRASLNLKLLVVVAFCQSYICQQIEEIEENLTLKFPQNGGNYPRCTRQAWRFTGPNKNSFIEVTLKRLDLKAGDNLCYGIGRKVDVNEKASFTAKQLIDVGQKMQVLQSRDIWVRFFSDKEEEGTGFELKFRVMKPCPGAGGKGLIPKRRGRCYVYADFCLEPQCVCYDGYTGDLCGRRGRSK